MSEFIATWSSGDRPHSVRFLRPVILGVLAVIVSTLLAATPAPAQANQTTPEAVVHLLLPELNRYWGQVVRSHGKVLPGPKFVWYNTKSNPGPYRGWTCEPMETFNAGYCSAKGGTIAIDYRLASWALSKYGDMAVGYVLVHEYAHHLQRVTGWSPRDRPDYSPLSAREDGADECAGIFARHLDDIRWLETGDLREAELMAEAVGGDGVSYGATWQRGRLIC